jgi:cytochrome c553
MGLRANQTRQSHPLSSPPRCVLVILALGSSRVFRRPQRWPGCLLVFLTLFSPAAAADPQASQMERGQKIYAESCVQCHGSEGQGVDQFYAKPLAGDLTVGELAELIADTMPEDEPETCVGEDAEAVAAYLHHTFYSEAAQVRNRPPHAPLSRLTGVRA